jgi:uncharacterized protein DUF4383
VRLRAPVQLAALLVAGLAALAGILGFVPGVTTGHLAFAGHGSRAELFGLFRTSVLENLLYLAGAAVGLALARTREGARTFLVAGGVGLLLLWLLAEIGHGGWLPTNRAADWLHVVAGACLLGLAFVTSRDVAETRD